MDPFIAPKLSNAPPVANESLSPSVSIRSGAYEHLPCAAPEESHISHASLEAQHAMRAAGAAAEAGHAAGGAVMELAPIATTLQSSISSTLKRAAEAVDAIDTGKESSPLMEIDEKASGKGKEPERRDEMGPDVSV
ncbi:hypothetical protein HDU93_009972 [Gonapodya sp. JEL0774]|nr:hypothetical protein HDU93_009972 [Gonapodya sp. JEL0774]